jgi:hypothetical protein
MLLCSVVLAFIQISCRAEVPWYMGNSENFVSITDLSAHLQGQIFKVAFLSDFNLIMELKLHA